MRSYQPPVLPHYLAETYQLRTIVDVPSNEEVMTIHAVIRSLEGTLHLPGLYDPNLAVELSQYLFDAQMARYRDRHSFSVFPMDITYTPPQLPAHISIALEPVQGAPSNEQIKAVQTALRASEGLSSLPRLFDANLSMELSQHLFDLQMARCIQRSSRGHDSSNPARSEATPEQHNQANVEAISISDDTRYFPPSRNNQANSESNTVSSTRADPVESTEILDNSPVTHAMEHAKTVHEQSNLILTEIRDIMVDVKQILIATEHTMVRGPAHNSFRPYLFINSKGHSPDQHGLPRLWYHSSLGMQGLGPDNLARFLRFYSIGDQYLEEGDTATLKEGTYDSAAALLASYLRY